MSEDEAGFPIESATSIVKKLGRGQESIDRFQLDMVCIDIPRCVQFSAFTAS